ncbi:MAG: hypothetical protein IPK03_05470 [Bacteroidetes bacterium]|nr:hypothetical protein [Bacteroidota bacterium]
MNKYTFFIISTLMLMQISCTDPKVDKWDFSKTELLGKLTKADEKLNVDIYLDATTSMQGFASSSTTNYARLLDDLELVVKNIWKKLTLNFKISYKNRYIIS